MNNLLQGEMNSREPIDLIFNDLEKQILDRNEISLDFHKIVFVSVYFLKRLEAFVKKANGFNTVIRLVNIPPSVYKVFQVARLDNILKVCF